MDPFNQFLLFGEKNRIMRLYEGAIADFNAAVLENKIADQKFDYIGVIFGNDLVYDAGKQQWQSVPRNSHDTQVKRNYPDLARHLQNVYRVLMSRAHRGVYVYFMDKETEQRFRRCAT